MVLTYDLTTIQDAVLVATTLTKSWFRGQSRIFGTLIPSMFRPQFNDDFLRVFRPTLELEMIESFKRDAPTLATGELPDDDDNLGWLYVMQHYGAPTRLLDWTENALAALYFAVQADFDIDGEIWAMLPWALNQHTSSGWGLPLATDPTLRYLIDEPFMHPQKESPSKDPPKPIAFLPRRGSARMLAQLSAFTIHSRESMPIPDILTNSKHLVRYRIPARCKHELRRNLMSLGVSHRLLFPDFEGLSRTVIREAETVAYAPPNPPMCSGEWRPDSSVSNE